MTSSAIVVDANIAIYLALPYPLTDLAADHWKMWAMENRLIAAPRLWLSEVTSTIHRTYMQRLISHESAIKALDVALGLRIEIVDETFEMCHSAFDWATRLGQHATYDALYLALTEGLGAQFWTADQRLVNRTRQLGIEWVRWIGET